MVLSASAQATAMAFLYTSGSAVPATGWAPQFITLHRDGQLHAACANYLKSHSYGEYVFDWAWADAYRRHGLRYYPKLLCAAPFTPVPGTRLMARDGVAREHLAHALLATAQGAAKLSSAHVLFIDAADRAALQRQGWMIREGVQFHWTQDTANPVTDFTDLLSRLQRDKRKKIQQERRRVADQGITFTAHEGAEISDSLWDFFYRCYTLTYQAHHSTPYLTRDFFARMAQTMAAHWLMFVARRDGFAGPVTVSAAGLPAGVTVKVWTVAQGRRGARAGSSEGVPNG